LLFFDKLSVAFLEDFFTDTRFNDFDLTWADRAPNDLVAVPASARSISEP
jgi:hypothetical protein